MSNSADFSSSFRGAAPIHHALLAGERRTGITLQTLDPYKMDHGVILDQTPRPGFDIPNPETCTAEQLLDLVTPKAADMLLKGIQNRVFVPPLKGIGWRAEGDGSDLRFAGKIKTEDRHIDWNKWTWEEIKRRERVLGPLWSNALVPHSTAGKEGFQNKRIIFTKMELADNSGFPDPAQVIPGLPFAANTKPPHSGGGGRLYVYTSDGKLVEIHEMKVEGKPAADAYRAAQKAMLMRRLDSDGGLFHGRL